jgi:predicted amidohydrolase
MSLSRSTVPALALGLIAIQAALAGERPGTPAGGPDHPAVRQLRVAVAQPLVAPGAVDKNVRNMEPPVVDAVRRGAEMVVFSECVITGYDLKGVGAKAAVALDAACLDDVAKMAQRHGVVIVAGFHERQGDRLFNSAGVFYPEGRRVVQRKHLIMEPERAVAPITAGPRRREIFSVAGLRCAVLICSDSGIPGIYEELAAARCDLILLLTAGAGDVRFGIHQADLADGKTRKRHARQAAECLSAEAIERCIRLDCAQVACNQAGWDAQIGYFHPGGSSIVDRTGEVTAVIPPRFVFEHLRADLAVGLVSCKKDRPE